MKIGILTLPLHTNYGGILQAWALQTVLERMGHEVKVINLDRTPTKVGLFENIYLNFYCFFAFLKHGKFYHPSDFNEIRKETFKKYLIKTQFTQKFIDKYIKSYYVVNYTEDIKPTDFDCIVVGSDQIWNRGHGGIISGSVSNAYLSFLKSETPVRFSYAASFGKDNWEYSIRESYKSKKAIKKFRAVSVRELSGIELCKKHFNVEAVHHVDPTMLLKKEDYINGASLRDISSSSGTLLVYFIDSSSEKNRIVDYIEDKLSLSRFVVNSKAEDTSVNNLKIEDCIQPPVETWLRGFMDAEFVVTDSFHACVFSIIFHKPFIVVGNVSRGLARFNSLLNKFGLEERLVFSLDDVKSFDFSCLIDYCKIDCLLEIERSKSMSYLKNNIS